jgi:dual specificity tyrosine-phosphorylation-regulated kinase 1
LIDTYKHINKVYYEERDARRAARAAQKQKGQGAHNDGYDDENYDYIVTSGEMFYGRYVIKERIGKGSFGQVVRAVDSETNKDVAIKIIKSKKPFLMQAKTEIELLSHLQDKDPDDQNNVVRLLTHFIYRNHQCLVFEMLSLNLYELLKNTQFGGVSLNLIRKFAKQILKALSFLARSDVDVIHCDLKPENILLRHPKRSGVKVIDFGSSCRSNKRMYSYIQSRFYRSPEVMLGLPYTVAIDMWSLGCILVEMHTGEPLFSGSDQFDQMQKIVKMLGMVPMHMLEQASDTHRLQFFEKAKTDAGVEEWTIRQVPASSSSSPRTSSSPKKIVPGKDPIKSITDVVGADTTRKKKHPPSETGNSPRNYELFVDLVYKMLTYDPRHRIKPEEALEHPFIAPPEESHVVTSQPSSGVKQAPSPAPAGRKQTEAGRPEEG